MPGVEEMLGTAISQKEHLDVKQHQRPADAVAHSQQPSARLPVAGAAGNVAQALSKLVAPSVARSGGAETNFDFLYNCCAPRSASAAFAAPQLRPQ